VIGDHRRKCASGRASEGSRRHQKPDREGTSEVNARRAVELLKVMGGDRQVVSLAGLHLLGDLADRVGLTAG
jgi:hypothetical protein